MIRGLDHHSYKNSLEKRNLRGNITGAFQYLKWACKNEGEGLFTQADSARTRKNGFNLKEIFR